MNSIDQLYMIAKKQERKIEDLQYALRLAQELIPQLWDAGNPAVQKGDYSFVLAELAKISKAD